MAVADVALEQPRGLARALAHREGARDPERIEAVQVAPGGQHLGRAQQIAARCRADEPSVQGAQDRRHLVFLTEQAVGVGELREQREHRVVVGDRAGRERLRRRCAVGQRLDRAVIRSAAVCRLGHREQHVDTLGGRTGASRDVQAVGDQRVLQFQHGLGERDDRGVGVTGRVDLPRG